MGKIGIVKLRNLVKLRKIITKFPKLTNFSIYPILTIYLIFWVEPLKLWVILLITNYLLLIPPQKSAGII